MQQLKRTHDWRSEGTQKVKGNNVFGMALLQLIGEVKELARSKVATFLEWWLLQLTIPNNSMQVAKFDGKDLPNYIERESKWGRQ